MLILVQQLTQDHLTGDQMDSLSQIAEAGLIGFAVLLFSPHFCHCVLAVLQRRDVNIKDIYMHVCDASLRHTSCSTVPDADLQVLSRLADITVLVRASAFSAASLKGWFRVSLLFSPSFQCMFSRTIT